MQQRGTQSKKGFSVPRRVALVRCSEFLAQLLRGQTGSASLSRNIGIVLAVARWPVVVRTAGSCEELLASLVSSPLETSLCRSHSPGIEDGGQLPQEPACGYIKTSHSPQGLSSGRRQESQEGEAGHGAQVSKPPSTDLAKSLEKHLASQIHSPAQDCLNKS